MELPVETSGAHDWEGRPKKFNIGLNSERKTMGVGEEEKGEKRKGSGNEGKKGL